MGLRDEVEADRRKVRPSSIHVIDQLLAALEGEERDEVWELLTDPARYQGSSVGRVLYRHYGEQLGVEGEHRLAERILHWRRSRGYAR